MRQQQLIVLLPLYYQCLIKPLNILIFIVDNKSLLLHSYTRALRSLLFNIISSKTLKHF